MLCTCVARVGLLLVQLLDKVRSDLVSMQDRFKARYQESNAFAASNVRDIPPVSGMVLWMRQIHSKVTAHVERVKNILGKDWATHVEFRKLKVRGFICGAGLGSPVLPAASCS